MNHQANFAQQVWLDPQGDNWTMISQWKASKLSAIHSSSLAKLVQHAAFYRLPIDWVEVELYFAVVKVRMELVAAAYL